MKIISIIKNGKRVDIPQAEFQKMLEKTNESLRKEQKDEV